MLFYFACEAAGALSARHSLRPLFGGSRIKEQTSSKKPAARSRSRVPTSLRGAPRRSNPAFFAAPKLDCFAELAMTDEKPRDRSRRQSRIALRSIRATICFRGADVQTICLFPDVSEFDVNLEPD